MITLKHVIILTQEGIQRIITEAKDVAVSLSCIHEIYKRTHERILRVSILRL